MINNVILNAEQKARQINLDTTIYGSFVEIGAGQEVARNFFKANISSCAADFPFPLNGCCASNILSNDK